jgi:hypothetical protein
MPTVKLVPALVAVGVAACLVSAVSAEGIASQVTKAQEVAGAVQGLHGADAPSAP